MVGPEDPLLVAMLARNYSRHLPALGKQKQKIRPNREFVIEAMAIAEENRPV